MGPDPVPRPAAARGQGRDARDSRSRRQAGPRAGGHPGPAARGAGGDRGPRAVSRLHALREGQPDPEPRPDRRRPQLSAPVVRDHARPGPPLRHSHRRAKLPELRRPDRPRLRLAARARPSARRRRRRRGEGLGQQRLLGPAAGQGFGGGDRRPLLRLHRSGRLAAEVGGGARQRPGGSPSSSPRWRAKLPPRATPRCRGRAMAQPPSPSRSATAPIPLRPFARSATASAGRESRRPGSRHCGR